MVDTIEMLNFPSLLYDLATGPIQIPVLLYMRNQKQEKTKEQSAFENDVANDILRYNKAKNK